ncbi:hypothetical protein BJF83_13765 [Nocardiopsis sp. CNR-923]|uniref:DUF4429 domain-containing protein n=1 Tax=Nocardiopsis sp. CNR-923 TaxID=1904965 RepID=UPI00095ABF8E|nr:DUF4429 domain-containing protein [Nocardiopsis sp. CNR-923]OLT28849.1 hypothetical protein BJF83_13765 [Nocardiopsis sp. CNR-923]
MEELRGHHGTWRIDEETVRIRFDSGRKVPTLLRHVSECAVPLVAVREVEFGRGDRKRGWRMRLWLVDGADPYAGLGAPGRGATTPLELTGPYDGELVAEYVADKITSAVGLAREIAGGAVDPREVARSLVARPPFQARTAEGTATFDGTRVRLQWDGLMASSAKEKEKAREFRLAEIAEARWFPPVDLTEGLLRIELRGVSEATDVAHDFFTLASHGTKGSEETLLMAATINAHRVPAEPEAAPPGPLPAPLAEQGAEAVLATIRELGRLHAEGLLTDEEFDAKKAELLGRL